jgi:hypothetical protein
MTLRNDPWGLISSKIPQKNNYIDALPNSLMDSTMSPKVKITKGKGVGALPSSQHFGGGKGVLELRDGTRTSDKWVNYSHRPAQTKQQVNNGFAFEICSTIWTMDVYVLKNNPILFRSSIYFEVCCLQNFTFYDTCKLHARVC